MSWLIFGMKSVPFWANLAERWRRVKTILLFSISCWILFTLGVGLIQPPVHSCLMHNGSHIFFEKKPTISHNRFTHNNNNKNDLIQKRQFISEQYDNDVSFNANHDTMSGQPYFGSMLFRRKRQAPFVYKQPEYIIENVTRIVYEKKKTSTNANMALTPNVNTDDELEFKLTKSQRDQESVADSLVIVKNGVAAEILKNSKSK